MSKAKKKKKNLQEVYRKSETYTKCISNYIKPDAKTQNGVNSFNLVHFPKIALQFLQSQQKSHFV